MTNRSGHHHHGHGTIDGRASRFYDLMARRIMRGFYRRVADDLADSAPQSVAVLDVGTGPGILLAELAKRRPDLSLAGVDLSQDMVDAAARNLGDLASIRNADVRALPYEDDSFDLVVSSLSSHHWDDPEVGAAEIARVTRPGGRMLVYDLERAPFDALAPSDRFKDVRRDRFRTGWTMPLRCNRFEATVRAE